MLAAENWCVKVQGKVYGPYAFEQLERFAEEGRLAEWSMIAPAGGQEWREAVDEPRFARVFARRANEQSMRGNQFGRRRDQATGQMDGPPTTSARPRPRHVDPAAAPRRAEPIGARRATPTAKSGVKSAVKPERREDANFIVIFDVVSGAASRVESGMRSLGASFQIADNVWSVSSRLTAAGVRNALSPYLRPHESLFVIDATNGGATWQNYAPEPHAKISAAYMRQRLAANA